MLSEIAGLSLLAVLYNNGAYLLPGRLHERFYILFNLSFLGLVLLWAMVGLALSTEELGLAWSKAGPSALWGLALGGAVVSPVLVLAALPRAMPKVQDPRLAGLTPRQAAFRALVRIPLGTAVFEELLFRGVLFGLVSQHGWGPAVWASSLVFGLWHIVPTLHLLRAIPLARRGAMATLALTGGLVAAAAGGALFALLRHYTDSVAGPVVAHATINSVALAAAYVRRRRVLA